MSTMTEAECVSRINEIKARMEQIFDEQELLTADLSTLQQQWVLSLDENILVKSKEQSRHLLRHSPQTTSAIKPTAATQSSPHYIQIKEGDMMEVCANCETSGHTLENCIKQEQDGFVHGCPRCNTKTHNFDNCTYGDGKDLYFLVRQRDGLPPIRTEKDYRDLPGFDRLDERPWTPEFSKKHLNSYQSYEYKTRRWKRTDIPDPAWLQEDQIPEGSLAHSAALRDAAYATQAPPRSKADELSALVSDLYSLTPRSDKTDNTDGTTPDLGPVQNRDRIVDQTRRLANFSVAERVFIKHRKADMIKRRFWTACFRGVENQ